MFTSLGQWPFLFHTDTLQSCHSHMARAHPSVSLGALLSVRHSDGHRHMEGMFLCSCKVQTLKMRTEVGISCFNSVENRGLERGLRAFKESSSDPRDSRKFPQRRGHLGELV